jgi:hypothetical protein
VLLHVLRRGTLLGIWILRWRSAIPLVGAWETVLWLLLLVLGMLAGSHVGAWLLGWWRWERGAHLKRGQVSARYSAADGEMRGAGGKYDAASGRLTWPGGGYAPLAGCWDVGGCQWVGSWPWPPWW